MTATARSQEPETMLRCRLCGSARLRTVVDLGATPPCERFLTADQLDLAEPTYPLHLRACEECLLLQIPALITPEDTFTEYAYFSSYSESWLEHARRFVDQAVAELQLDSGSFVVEVASNDGYLLANVVEKGIPCLGIEPSSNVGDAAVQRGVPTLNRFLDEEVADDVVASHGAADLVVANNVYAHIPDLRGFTRSLRRLMKPDAWLSIEVHHALNLVALGQFDTIYHEHFQYYTVLSIQRSLAVAGLVVCDIEMLPTHGGSIRAWARPAECEPRVSDRVGEALAMEAAAGLHSIDGYLDLEAKTNSIKDELLRFLLDCKHKGLRVAGYGAPGKGNTLLNYCGIRPDLLPYTVDRNPYKVGRFTPGTRIPIKDVAFLAEDKPDVVLGLPWNLENEIAAQLSYISAWQGELYFPLPTLHRGGSW